MKCDCGCEMGYNERHDSRFCKTCDEWKSARCSDVDCEFCADRPKKPSDVENL